MKSLLTARQATMLWLTVIAIILHSALVAYSYSWNIDNIHASTLRLAAGEARGNWQKDAAFRRWATRHGGVYVPVDERTQPSPYLAHLPDRDVVTTQGKALTLMNPAFMMSQMTSEFEALYGVKGRITGLIQLNPANAPDPWEREILERYEAEGAREVVAEQNIAGEPFLRLMRPMYMTEGCVKCHGHLGFKDGDLRGGVSVSVPMDNYQASEQSTIQSIRGTHLFIWVLGCLAILSFGLLIRRLLLRMEHSATHDDMTGLPNIAAFRKSLWNALADDPADCAVCFIDLDRFKLLNDSYGHAYGDELLVKFARRVEKTLPPDTVFARMGGDEFLLLVTGDDALARAHACASAIRETLRQPFGISGVSISASACFGICHATTTHRAPDDIIRDADIAMYHAKRQGEGQIREFESSLHHLAQKTLSLENDLRTALAHQQFRVHYQPIVHTEQKRIVGFETLLRWEHPELGLVTPDDFIAIAERSGQIRDIGEWVLEQACQQAAHWNVRFGSQGPLFVAVNLSSIQLLDEALPEKISALLARSGLPPGLLHLEVTESSLVEHTDRARDCLAALRKIGASISIDDFGTGYCSISYLQQFQFDTMKIDKSFVRAMGRGGRGWKLISSLVFMAKALRMNVIAEGIESAQELRALKDFKCTLCQGFLFARPAPAADIEALLGQRDSLPGLS